MQKAANQSLNQRMRENDQTSGLPQAHRSLARLPADPYNFSHYLLGGLLNSLIGSAGHSRSTGFRFNLESLYLVAGIQIRDCHLHQNPCMAGQSAKPCPRIRRNRFDLFNLSLDFHSTTGADIRFVPSHRSEHPCFPQADDQFVLQQLFGGFQVGRGTGCFHQDKIQRHRRTGQNRGGILDHAGRRATRYGQQPATCNYVKPTHKING